MLLIYSSKITTRLQYTCNWIFNQLVDGWKLTTDLEEFRNASTEKILYSESVEINSGLVIHPSELIMDDLIHTGKPVKSMIGDLPVLYPDKTEFGFDIFSAIFFMLSRYEEYLPFKADKHGRFPASESFAFLNSFLDLPVCDIWVNYLKQKLSGRYKNIVFYEIRPRCILTYDLDVIFKYKGRGLLRQCGAIAKDLSKFQMKRIKERAIVLAERRKDPWDITDFIKSQTEKISSTCICFIPVSSKTEYDRNLNPSSRALRTFFKTLKSFSEIGIHPSYFSSVNDNLIFTEKNLLEKKSGVEIDCSRQHFLRFRMPDTFFKALDAGIKEEYSMAFPDMSGFRAGTSHPFKFYDLKNEVETDLVFYPSCFMDQTCISYLKYDTEKSWELMKKFIDIVFKYRGIFIPIFHNDHLEYAEWKNLHNRMTSYLQKLLSNPK